MSAAVTPLQEQTLRDLGIDVHFKTSIDLYALTGRIWGIIQAYEVTLRNLLDAQARYLKLMKATNESTDQTTLMSVLNGTGELQAKAEHHVPLLRDVLEKVSEQARMINRAIDSPDEDCEVDSILNPGQKILIHSCGGILWRVVGDGAEDATK